MLTVRNLIKSIQSDSTQPRPKVMFEPGEIVRIIDGPFNDFNGEVEKVDFVGLATEYCVKFTALDSVSEGFYTRVITKCTKGLNENDCKLAFDEMRDKGIVLI